MSLSDLAESQRNRENNDFQDLVESLVARYLYPWLKPDIYFNKKLDLGDYVILDEHGMEQCENDHDLIWGDSLDFEDSISKIIEEQYAILTEDGDEVPLLLYSVQNQAEQSTPMKDRKKKTLNHNKRTSLSKKTVNFPESEIYGLIDSDLSSEEKEYDILLSLLDEYVLVTKDELSPQNAHLDNDIQGNGYELQKSLAEPDSPWRFSGFCIEMESLVADEKDKGKMFTGFLKKHLPSYEVIDEELDSDSQNMESTFNEDNTPVCACRKIRFSDDMVYKSAVSCSQSDISENELDMSALASSTLYSVDGMDSGFSSDELQSSAVYFDKAVGSPDNQAEMLNPLPESWELSRGESMIPFWLQEDDEAQVLPTCEIFSYSKDRIKGAYNVYWVEGERVVQFTDSGDDIFHCGSASQCIPEESDAKHGVYVQKNQVPFINSPLTIETPSMKHRPSMHRISELYPANPVTNNLEFQDLSSSSKIFDSKPDPKAKSRKRNTGIQTFPCKIEGNATNTTSDTVIAQRWSLKDFKPFVYVLQGTLTPNKVLVASFIPFGIMGSWLGFKFMTGQM